MNRAIPYSSLSPKLPPSEHQKLVEHLEERASLLAYLHPSPSDEADSPDVELVREWVSHLSTDDQSLFYDYFGMCNSLQEIGDELGISKQAVWKRIQRLKKRLRDWLEARGYLLGGSPSENKQSSSKSYIQR